MHNEKQKFKSSWIVGSLSKLILQSLMIFTIAFISYVFFSYLTLFKANSDRTIVTFGDSSSIGISKPIILGEEDELQIREEVVEMESDNFLISDVAVINRAEELEQTDRSTPLEITGMKSELVTDKNQEKIKLLLTLTSSKQAVCWVEYQKKGESGERIEEDNAYGFSHAFILDKLSPSSAYSYQYFCNDKWGTVSESEKFSFYTGAPKASLVDVFEDAVSQVFGWAMKK